MKSTEQPLCASIGHRQAQVFVYRCDHVGSTHVVIQGGTCDDPELELEMTYGPFDDDAWIRSDIERLVREAVGRLFT